MDHHVEHRVPNYALYGEDAPQRDVFAQTFAFHCEILAERSRIHNWFIRPHRHPSFAQLLYISSGSGSLMTEQGDQIIQTPALVIVPLNTVHGFRFSHDVQGFVFTYIPEHIQIDGRLSEGFADSEKPRQIALDTLVDATARDEIVRILVQIRREAELCAAGHETMLSAYVSAVLTLCERERVDAERRLGARNVAVDRDRIRLRQFEMLLARHLKNHKPVSFYAAELGISAAHLGRLCRQSAGVGPAELIARRLTDEACRGLTMTMLTIKQVAYNLGFEDPAYFTRFFARRMGMRPTEYRKGAKTAIDDPI